jgi:hypothetical protein
MATYIGHRRVMEDREAARLFKLGADQPPAPLWMWHTASVGDAAAPRREPLLLWPPPSP